MIQSHISAVSLSITSPDDIIKQSVCEINTTNNPINSTTDPRLGSMDTKACASCGLDVHKCQGHFGHIRLPFKIPNPLFSKHIIRLLRSYCFECRQPLDTPNTTCPNHIQHVVFHKKDTDTFYDKTTDTTMDADTLHDLLASFTPGAEHMIMSVLPVLPIACRPNVFVNGIVHDDDMTTQYNDIVKLVQKYNASPDEKHATNIRFRIRCLMDNTSDKLKHINGRAFLGIKERIVGKSGQIRLYIMGKRVDLSARTVISAEPTLEIDQVGIPQYMAETLYYTEIYYQYNRERLERLYDCGVIQSIIRAGVGTRFNIKYLRNRTLRFVPETFTNQMVAMDDNFLYVFYGDTICRNLMDGDTVLFNRQPTLHRHGMTAMKARILPGKTLRINLAITKQFNADFDGDECNIHVPMNIDSRAELEELASVRANIISVQSSCPTLAIVQDTLLGAYLMTREPQTMARGEAVQLLIQVGIDLAELAARLPTTADISTLDILSFTLPPTMNHDPIICDGRFCDGTVLTKKLLSNTRTSLIRIIHQQFGPDAVLKFINRIQWIVTTWNSSNGFTIGIGDCRSIPHVCVRIDDNETSIQHLHNIRDRAMVAARDYMIQSGSRLIDSITSGAKGDIFNACQITSLLGQQSVGGRDIVEQITYARRTLPHVPLDASPSVRATSKGFICGNFFDGLSAHEYFFHSISSREGIIDTAMRTASSGYIQRKINKLCEDVRIQYDGTVRGNGGLCYALHYNNGKAPEMI